MSSRRRRDLPRALHPATGRENARHRIDEMHPVRSVQRLLPASVKRIVVHVTRQPSLFYSSHLCLLTASHFVHFCRCVRVTSPAYEYAIRACGPSCHRRRSVPVRVYMSIQVQSNLNEILVTCFLFFKHHYCVVQFCAYE